ncbi:MAG: hypothetical protein ACJAWW_000731 [Sulfurimonas sp.]|jgi:hypothetical protein
MNNYIKIILSITTASLLMSGCASKTSGIGDMENKKYSTVKEGINLSSSHGYLAYIEDDRISYLCGEVSACKPKEKDQQTFWVNSSGYYPDISTSTRGVQCGKGSLAGWLAIFPMKPFWPADYDSINSKVCNSNYTAIDSTQIGERFAFGLVTFMTPFVTAGNMHTKKYDNDKLIEAVYDTKIETFKEELFRKVGNKEVNGSIDFVYLDSGDIEDNLEDKYNSLLKDSSKKAGIVFLEEDTNKFLGINVFKEHEKKDGNIIGSISSQIEGILNNIAKNNKYVLRYDDVVSYIPSEVALPKIPKIPTLVKDEFENKAKFNERVKKSVSDREETIRNLQHKYSRDVLVRNTYIDNLQNSYRVYLEQKAEEKNKLLVEMKMNIPILSKVLFLENTSGYGAKDFKYNAELEKLYFSIYSQQQGFEQEVVASIPPSIAKQIKKAKTFRVIPEIEADGTQLKLTGFDILETVSNDSFKISYTDENYKPEMVSVSVVGMKESINKSISNHFKKYKQEDTAIVDTSKKEIWYIDIAQKINAKVPKWFSNPSITSLTIGYGSGKTLEEAKIKARNDLALMINVKVSTVFKNTESVNNFKSFSETKQQTEQSSDIELKSSDYRVSKQDRIDGRWYVGLESTIDRKKM